MRWEKDHIKPRCCLQCNKQLTLNQLYRKNKYCGLACSSNNKKLPNPEFRRVLSQSKYLLKNKELIKERQRKLLKKRRELVYKLLGDSCKRCGFSDKRALQIDHINGFGLKSRNKRVTNNRQYHAIVIASVLNNENKYQILCANCNWIKRYENKENSFDYKNGTHELHMKRVNDNEIY